jgi:hypothetical protein
MSPLIISKLPSSPAASGFLCRFVSEFPPFDTFEFGLMTRTLNYQLETGNHLIGALQDQVVGYLGWILTSDEIAERWVQEDGPLTPVRHGTSVAITVMATKNSQHILPLVREAKRLNPTLSVYWKRHLTARAGYAARFVRKRPL